MGGVRNVSRDLHSEKAGSGVRLARVSKKDVGNRREGYRTGNKAIGKALVTSGYPGDPDYEEFDSVWEALGFSPQEAANLQMRANLMIQMRKVIETNRWTQAAAAKKCGVTQPRMNDLVRGRIDKFSIDALVNMSASMGWKIDLLFKAS